LRWPARRAARERVGTGAPEQCGHEDLGEELEECGVDLGSGGEGVGAKAGECGGGVAEPHVAGGVEVGVTAHICGHADLDDVREEEEHARVHAGAQADRGQDTKADPPDGELDVLLEQGTVVLVSARDEGAALPEEGDREDNEAGEGVGESGDADPEQSAREDEEEIHHSVNGGGEDGELLAGFLLRLLLLDESGGELDDESALASGISFVNTERVDLC